MTVFVDTSALCALLDKKDPDHDRASRMLTELSKELEPLVTHNYVIVEASAVVQRRLGAPATRALLQDLTPAIDVVWVDQATHAAGVAALLAAVPTAISLVDFVSFELMRDQRLRRAFAFDSDFLQAGFEVVPQAK